MKALLWLRGLLPAVPRSRTKVERISTPTSSKHFDHLLPGAQHAWDLQGAWGLKESCTEIETELHEFMIEGGAMTTAAGNHHVLGHCCSRNAIRLYDAVTEVRADGSFTLSTNSGRAVYHRFELPDPATRFSLQGQWLWQDTHDPSDSSSLSIQGACWHLVVKSQTESHGLLHQRASDGAVTIHSCPIHLPSTDQLILTLPGNKQFCFSRCRQQLCVILEESNEDVTI